MTEAQPTQFERIIATFWGDEKRAYAWLGGADPRFARRGRPTVIHPTAEDWDLYRKAIAGLEALEAYKHTRWAYDEDGMDWKPEVPEPEDLPSTEWLETVDEWLDRCRQLRAAEEARSDV